MKEPLECTNPASLCFRGDTNSVTIQSVDPDIEQEQIPEDLGKLTEVDKARIGRVSFSCKIKIKTKSFLHCYQKINALLLFYNLLHEFCLHLGFQVKLEMYVEYFRTIGLALIVPILFLYAFQQGASLSYNYWLSLWADEPIINGTQLNTDMKLGVYGALGFAQGN